MKISLVTILFLHLFCFVMFKFFLYILLLYIWVYLVILCDDESAIKSMNPETCYFFLYSSLILILVVLVNLPLFHNNKVINKNSLLSQLHVQWSTKKWVKPCLGYNKKKTYFIMNLCTKFQTFTYLKKSFTFLNQNLNRIQDKRWIPRLENITPLLW